MTALTDYSADLHRLAALAVEPRSLDELLAQALVSLRRVVPYDLAAIYELAGRDLFVRAAEGPLASDAVRRHRLALDRFPTIRHALETRRPFPLEEHHHQSAEGDPYDGVLDLPDGHSCMLVPLFAGARDLGLITLDRRVCGRYSDDVVEMAGVYGQIVSMAMAFAEQAQLLERYRHRLKEENRLLREEVRGYEQATRYVRESRSPVMRDVARLAEQVARSSMPVLVIGETGSGKEVLAQAIHAWSARADQPFVKLNCAAIPENLVESELFGYVRGAFSGAGADRPGRFLTANGGTLFLDEIGDMPLAAQAKLLRVLQEGTFEPVGSDRTVRVDVRVIAATHVDLPVAVHEHRFREDLYFRIAVFPLWLPPLRERRADIVPLAEHVLEDIASERGLGPWTLSAAARAALTDADWPGNVRQLVNTLERAAILLPRGELGVEHLAVGAPVASAAPALGRPAPVGERLESFAENERRHLRRALELARGKIYGPDGAATLLGLRPTTLQSKLRKHKLR
jgi:transcriptional regulator with GAF, ATPase, and Fis domain